MSRGINFVDDILDGSLPNTEFDGIRKAWNIYNGKGESIGYSIEYKDRVVYYYHTKKRHYEDIVYGDTLGDRIVYLYDCTDIPVAIIAKILGCSRMSVERHGKKGVV